jgi:hypothetical protein
MDRDKNRIGPEYIDISDWRNMVKLFIAVARHGAEYEPGMAVFKRRIEKRYDELKHLLGNGSRG